MAPCMRMRTTSMGLNIALPTAPVVAPAAMRQDTESASPKVPESTMAFLTVG